MKPSHAAGSEDRLVSWLGTSLLACASIMAILIFSDRTSSELFAMPRIWYETRDLHILVCVVLALFAAVLLKSPMNPQENDDQPRPIFQTVRFFTRSQCSLCDQGLETLHQFDGWLPEVDVVDVDRSPELKRQFGESVPVLELDGKVRFRGSIPRALLQRLIFGTLQQLKRPADPADHHSDQLSRQSGNSE